MKETNTTTPNSGSDFPKISSAHSSSRWQMRQVVTFVLFSVLLMIILFGAAGLTMFNPIVGCTLSGAAGAFFAAPVFMLMVLKVNRPGMFTIFATAFSLAFSLMGEFFYMIPAYFLAGLLLDIFCLRTSAQRQSFAWISAAWTLFSGCYLVSSILPILIDLDNYVKDLVELRGMDQSFADAYIYFYSSPLWVTVIAIGTMIFGFLGSLAGRAMMRKHFQKAGVI